MNHLLLWSTLSKVEHVVTTYKETSIATIGCGSCAIMLAPNKQPPYDSTHIDALKLPQVLVTNILIPFGTYNVMCFKTGVAITTLVQHEPTRPDIID